MCGGGLHGTVPVLVGVSLVEGVTGEGVAGGGVAGSIADGGRVQGRTGKQCWDSLCKFAQDQRVPPSGKSQSPAATVTVV